MPIFDAQVHAYERNHPGRPWVGTLHGPAEVTGDQMAAAMDAVGVDGAVLVSPFSMYRYDASYAKEGLCCTDRPLGGEDWTVYQGTVPDAGPPPCHSKPTKTAVIISRSSGTE
jgi:hypothetical protein